MKKLKVVITSLFIGLAAGFIALEAVQTNAKAPDFTLTDTYGKEHKLSQYAGKTVVLEWVNLGCPFVKKHYESKNMQGLQKEFTAKGVIWLSICSSASGKQGNMSPEEWNKAIKDKEFYSTAVLLDANGKVGKLYGAKTTPHMFIVDSKGVLVYQGAIDDIASADKADVAKANNYVKQGLNEVLAGKKVSKGSTESYGCSVKY